jgi:hypothetical protein
VIAVRTKFMTPFVLVAATGASSCKPSHENPPGPSGNPPPPKTMTLAECKTVTVGTSCTYEYGECSIGPERADCGLQGYECKETAPHVFRWREVKFDSCD